MELPQFIFLTANTINTIETLSTLWTKSTMEPPDKAEEQGYEQAQEFPLADFNSPPPSLILRVATNVATPTILSGKS